jgi:hypothetical protein
LIFNDFPSRKGGAGFRKRAAKLRKSREKKVKTAGGGNTIELLMVLQRMAGHA